MRTTLRSFAGLLILGLLLLLARGVSADEKETRGEIRGSLTNGTTAKRVSGVEVTLKRYEAGEEKESRKIPSGPDGSFIFPGLDLRKGYSYALSTKYKDVEYNSPALAFKDQSREIPFEFMLYDPTDSDQEISVVMHHVIVEPWEGALAVRELMILENRGNRVYVGAHEIEPDKKETLRISLPSPAQGLELLRGLMSRRIVKTQDGFVDTMDIKPGRKEIHFSYKLDYRSSSFKLSKKINRMTAALDFFVRQGIRVEGENIEYAGLVGEPGKQFLHFSGKTLPKGSQVALNLENLPTAKKFFKKNVPILGVALLLFGLAYPLLRRRSRPGEIEAEVEEELREKPSVQEEKQSLLWAMAKLDDQMDAGKITPEGHEKKRRALKEKVIEVTRTLEGV